MSTPNRPMPEEERLKRVLYKQAQKLRRQKSTLNKQASTINEQSKEIVKLCEDIDELTNDTIGLRMAMHELCDEVDEISAKFKSQSDRVAVLEASAANDIFKIRCPILASVSQCPISPHRILARHISAHGGNVLADIDAIERMDRIYPDYAMKWRRGFELLYRLPFDSHRSTIMDAIRGCDSEQSAVQHLITTCNIRATTQVMNAWSQADNCRYQLLCDVLINGCIENEFSWEYWCRPEAVTVFNKIVNCYEDVLYQRA